MNVEKIGEAIRVLADCAGGEITPRRFRWAGRDYTVEAVNARWIDRQGQTHALHYSVQADGQSWYLHFDSAEMQWWVDETIVE